MTHLNANTRGAESLSERDEQEDGSTLSVTRCDPLYLHTLEMNDQKKSSQSVMIGEKEEGNGQGREKGAPLLFGNEGGKNGDDGENEMWSMWRSVLVRGSGKRGGHCHDTHSHGSSHFFPYCNCGYAVRSAHTISMEWSVRARNEKKQKVLQSCYCEVSLRLTICISCRFME